MPRRFRKPANRLTLYLDGPRITAERFLRAVNSFVGLIEDIAQGVAKQPKPIRWIISVDPGSVRLNADPSANLPGVPVGLVAASVLQGLNALETKARRPKGLSDVALRNARELASVADGKEVERAKVRLARRSASVTRNTVAHVDRILGVRVKDYGSVEGRLQMVSVRGGPHFSIDDALTGRSLQCIIEPSLLQAAMEAFPSGRVIVSGIIRYDELGQPFTVNVERIERFPERSALPTADDVYGILNRA